jgi:hypothetical protein
VLQHEDAIEYEGIAEEGFYPDLAPADGPELTAYAEPLPITRLQMMLWSVLFLMNIIDVSSTWYAFNLGCTEANPVMAFVYGIGGINALTLFKCFWLLVLLELLPHITGWKMHLLALCCVIYSALAVYHFANLSMIIR